MDNQKRRLARKQAQRAKVRRKKRRRVLVLATLLFSCLAAVALQGPLGSKGTSAAGWGSSLWAQVMPSPSPTASPVPTSTPTPTPSPTPAPPSIQLDTSSLYSQKLLLMDLKTGQVLASQGSDETIYPASLTKMLTALTVLETDGSLEDEVDMPQDIFAELYAQQASMAGFWAGEPVTRRDLLYGMMLPSGAECCVALARQLDGSEEAFVERMNHTAQRLGMTHSHFVNTTGLHQPQHTSTLEDLALLARYALQQPEFRTVFTSSQYTTAPTSAHPQGLTLYSTLFRFLAQQGETGQLPGGAILGGKTGFTDQAGLCLASLAQINGREYLLITAQAQGSAATPPYHVLDALEIYRQVDRQTSPAGPDSQDAQ
ncbi:D-alanyl-D-alanine carboxypeptidase family protein [uncultured Allofournierella sp.]|uniref:D-alanyl-D-alanine carboxypeptidase family protein n=1 Tax=uncultured Allofournierella sp. TaxID=1940258 RepID=UPI003752FDAD